MRLTRFFIIAAIAGSIPASCSSNNDMTDPGETTDTGVIIKGITWATRNIDAPGKFAKNEQSFGMLYQWNRKKGWPATGITVSGWDSNPDLSPDWTTSNNPCPAGWRLPTKEEFEKLCEVEYVWTSVHGVWGGRFVEGDNTIFLPAAGYRTWENGSLSSSGSYGDYYSSTPYEYSDDTAFVLSFTSEDWRVGTYHKGTGRCIRCVKE
ncbi:MAG: fibrobacter succinogenes major paralogous domain-containing protein [Bacteroidales bacterium]|nr:fibrobacter succinogenes major paralogous domain-containing protein [Bacteroidales bacterium]MCL2133670.1 fibrobacter succinogenes major paralogous domain-containing protein [Bacteroidales bacterium]